MSTKVIEKSTTYRVEPGPFEEVVAKLEANGWEVASDQTNFIILVHPKMAGHTRVVAKPDGTHT